MTVQKQTSNPGNLRPKKQNIAAPKFLFVWHLQETSSSSQDLSRRDINLLKIIICSGLFPQVAISDEHNSFKPDSEQAFHTKVSKVLLQQASASML